VGAGAATAETQVIYLLYAKILPCVFGGGGGGRGRSRSRGSRGSSAVPEYNIRLLSPSLNEPSEEAHKVLFVSRIV